VDRRQALPLFLSGGVLLGLTALTLAHKDQAPIPDAPARRSGPREAVDPFALSGEDKRLTEEPREETFTEEQRPSDAPVPTAAVPEGLSGFEGANAPALVFRVPSRWEPARPANPTRIAQWRLPGDPPAEVYATAGISGGVAANLERWKGQFPEVEGTPRTESIDLGAGLEATTLEVEGTFDSGMPGAGEGRKPGWALLGAVIEMQGELVFLKATGPRAAIDAARDEFREWVRSFRPRT
jgi:hypothetical protein